MSMNDWDNEWQPEIILSPRGITLPIIIRPHPNSKSTCVFPWHIFISNFNSKRQFIMVIIGGNWKLSPKGIAVPKIIRPVPNSNWICVMFMTHLYLEFQFKMSICYGDDERKLKIKWIFLSPRGITMQMCRKLFDRTQIRNRPVYSCDTSIYQISIQSVNL